MKPLFSIITVTFNARGTLPATIESIRKQTCKDFEHLIIDGASPDGTAQLAQSLCSETYTRIFSEPDNGLYDAMNKGVKLANGKYLIFLNAGDSFHSALTLKSISDAITDNKFPGIVYGQTQIVDTNRNRLADRHLSAPAKLTYQSFADGMVVCHQAFIASAQIASTFDLKYRYSADYDWCIKCLLRSKNNVYIDDILVDYLSEGVTTTNRRRSLMERFHIMRKNYGTVSTIIRHIRFIPRFIKRRSIEKSFNK